jgi:membrane associated rhomboid family serine protease
VLVYLAINIAEYSGASIFEYLALSRATVMAEPWTVVTYMFTQAGFMHLLGNMVTLYFFGSFLNRTVGTSAFLLIYLIGGLVAAGVVLWLSPPTAYTIGASGAVFALGGALAVLEPKIKVFIFPIPVPMPLWVAILVGFLVMAIMPSVSWQGHLGGLVAGLIAGLYLRSRMKAVL